MSLRILHVLDHSIPLHSGYTFRTLSILREQHRLGWDTFQLTTPKHGHGAALQETHEGLRFYRTPSPADAGLLAQMRLTARRIAEVVQQVRPHIIHAHSPVLNALPSLWVGYRQRLP
ncbi:MAG: glycosyltransferase, partial [Burkholderiaceae bacterium]